jgi:CheY-like chemotaxis protein
MSAMQSVEAVLGGRKVLVVEDDALLAFYLEDLLHGLGCVVLGPVASVADALAVLDRQRPDLALLDLELADGWSAPVAQALRAMDVPAAMITAFDGPTGEPVLAGMPRLAKPCSPQALHGLLLRLVPGAAPV